MSNRTMKAMAANALRAAAASRETAEILGNRRMRYSVAEHCEEDARRLIRLTETGFHVE